MAFEYLSNLSSERITGKIAPEVQLAMVHRLALAGGSMVAGQAIDLAAVNRRLNPEQLTRMHQLKTGALISTSVELGALSTGLATRAQLGALAKYSQAIGLAFQIQDDVLDITTDTRTLGKQQGADAAQNKPTFVSLLGLEGAKSLASQLHDEAVNALTDFDRHADSLRELAAYAIKRSN